MSNEKLTDQKVAALDAALAKVKNRKAQREGSAPADATDGVKTGKAPKAEKPAKEASAPKRPRLTDEEKAARQATKDAERAAKKAAREAAKAAKQAEKAANKQPAHMRKVMKAAEKLGTLDQAAQLLFNEATASLTAAELAALANHILHFNRVKATERALTQKIEAGNTVRIVSGDERYIGKTGVVSKAQRIRCYVTIEGVKKDVYLYTSNVELVTENQQAAVAS